VNTKRQLRVKELPGDSGSSSETGDNPTTTLKLTNLISVAPSSEQQSPVSLLASCLPSGLMLAFENLTILAERIGG
jgi:hypothetical protein